MPKQPNKRAIGIFMVSGIITLLIVFSIYLQRVFFSNDGSNVIVMYFEESIKGLNVGSSVVFKGVEIGKVVKIDLIANPQNMDFRIPVYAKMETYQGLSAREMGVSKREILNSLISKGLRARLTPQSYLTGQLMIELEMLPDTPVVLKNRDSDDEYLEIPTILSPMGEISKGIQNIPIRESVEKFNQFFDTLNQQAPVILPEIEKATKNLNQVLTENSGASTEALNNLNKAMISVNGAAKAFKNFADYLERHPEALLKGKRGGYN